jgi:serine/threonine protein kinase
MTRPQSDGSEALPRDDGVTPPLAESLEAATGGAPPYRAPMPGVPDPPGTIAAAPDFPKPGDRVDDFQLVRVLGAGSFGRVFLARQLSLRRLVALKVTAGRGHEARTLARLEHAHIVQVFSEAVEPERKLRLLCMQYVSGTTLARVIHALVRRDREQWSGRAILDVLDAAATEPVALNAAALRDRECLAGCDFVEAVCWLGARLAEALAHAHALGVLHRDVKPANVLLNRYGQPLLADFNVAAKSRLPASAAATGQASQSSSGNAPLGGTVAYMAPEHLDAFLAGPSAPPAVDERSDIYSLGVVLYELLTGHLPAADHMAQSGVLPAVVRDLAERRRAWPPDLPAGVEAFEPLARLIRRCLAPDPGQRPQSASELAGSLDGCRELRQVAKALPRALARWPFALGVLLLFLPHVLGSVVNVSYNALRIVQGLTAEQQAAFRHVLTLYNVAVYPACVVAMLALVVPLRRVVRALAGPEPPAAPAVAAARRRALRLPTWCVILSCVGWLPGAVLFPLGINYLAGPLDSDVFPHFLISFTIAGLIALTYSFFGAQYLALRVLYPMLWTEARDLRGTARAELAGLERRLAWFQALAVLIPLAAAVLMVGIGPEEFSEGHYRTFRVLVTALIALGMAGLGVTMQVSRRLHETLTALTGGQRR